MVASRCRILSILLASLHRADPQDWATPRSCPDRYHPRVDCVDSFDTVSKGADPTLPGSVGGSRDMAEAVDELSSISVLLMTHACIVTVFQKIHAVWRGRCDREPEWAAAGEADVWHLAALPCVECWGRENAAQPTSHPEPCAKSALLRQSV